MKTSQKIITVYITLIIGSIFFLVIDASIKAKNIHKNEIITLPPFSVIVAEKDADVHIIQSDSNYVALEKKEEIMPDIKLFNVINDTLHVYSGARMFINCNKLKSIIGNHAFWTGIDKYNTDSLEIDLSGGKFYFNSEDEMLKIDYIDLTTRDSAFVRFQLIENKRVNINATDKSNIELLGFYDEISGILKRKSKLKNDNNYRILHLERVE